MHRTETPFRPNLELEETCRETGCHLVAGLDEAGRGAWAGPVVAAAVMLPLDGPDLLQRLKGVRDSKQMSVGQRARWAREVRRVASALAVGLALSWEVDRLGVIPATRLAMRRALQALPLRPQHLLLDYLVLPDVETPQIALAHGDARSLSIAAASVIAKVSRDAMMQAYERAYPGYEFARHKGYGTAAHRAALDQLGPCSIHRRSYAPVAARVRQAA